MYRVLSSIQSATASGAGPSTVENAEMLPVSAPSESTSSGTTLRCKSAGTRDERALCKAVIPPRCRDDQDTLNSFEITYSMVDLNHDGNDEVIVWESSWAGTSGGGLWVLAFTVDGYQRLFETDAAWTPIISLPNISNGWSELSYFVSGGGVNSHFVVVRSKTDADLELYRTSDVQPEGRIVIGKKWNSTPFGPLPGQ